jgi:hypothetical protein
VLRAMSHLGGRWQMLTVTIRHRAGMNVATLLPGLTKSWREARQGGPVQRTWSARVDASVRATEITYRDAGPHPHFHVLLRTSEWKPEEKAALYARFAARVEKNLGTECVPSRERAMRWSDPIDATSADALRLTRYVLKLALEVVADKPGHSTSRTSWDVAEAAADGDAASRRDWLDFQLGTQRKRMIEMDDRASHAAKMAVRVPDGHEGVPIERARETTIRVGVSSEHFAALRELERTMPSVLLDILHDVRGSPCPEACVERWLLYAEGAHVRALASAAVL